MATTDNVPEPIHINAEDLDDRQVRGIQRMKGAEKAAATSFF